MNFKPGAWYLDLFSGRRGDMLSLLAGAALPLGFAPFQLSLLAVLSTALLFLLWLDIAPRRAFLRGWLFGVGMFGVGVSWVHVSFFEFGNVSLPLSVVLTALFAMSLALYPALLGYLLTRLLPGAAQPGRRLLLVAVFPAGWTLFEWLRGWFLTGFPWLNLGYSQTDTPLRGLAPLFGVYGISLAVALSAALLVVVVRGPAATARLRYAAALALFWLGPWLFSNAQWTQPLGEPLRVALIQGNVAQDLKWLAGQRQRTLDLYASLTRKHWDRDLIVWPETAVPAFYHQVAEDYLTPLAKEARARGTDLLVGLPYLDPASNRYYNSMLSLGAQLGFYHKRHLVPFGEYVPFKGILGGIIDFLQVPMSDFSAGNGDHLLLDVAGHKAGISICYEDAFGEEVIEGLPRAGLLVNVSNDAWFGDSMAPHQHLQIARMRALETGRPMLRATNNGVSAIIDHRGTVTGRSPQFAVDVLRGSIQPMQGATPYVRFGNYPVVILVLLVLGFAGYYGRVRRN